MPAPARLAPWAVALSAEVDGGTGDEVTTGRFVVLHDPAGQVAWEGTFRVVTLVRAALDPEVGSDPLLGKVAWTWVADALAEAGAAHCALGGTVTRVASGDPKLWRGILDANRDEVLRALRSYQDELQALHAALANRNDLELLAILERGKAWRDKLRVNP